MAKSTYQRNSAGFKVLMHMESQRGRLASEIRESDLPVSESLVTCTIEGATRNAIIRSVISQNETIGFIILNRKSERYICLNIDCHKFAEVNSLEIALQKYRSRHV